VTAELLGLNGVKILHSWCKDRFSDCRTGLLVHDARLASSSLQCPEGRTLHGGNTNALTRVLMKKIETKAGTEQIKTRESSKSSSELSYSIQFHSIMLENHTSIHEYKSRPPVIVSLSKNKPFHQHLQRYHTPFATSLSQSSASSRKRNEH